MDVRYWLKWTRFQKIVLEGDNKSKFVMWIEIIFSIFEIFWLPNFWTLSISYAGIGEPNRLWLFCLGPLVLLLRKISKLFGFSILVFTLSEPDEDYSRNVSCALNVLKETIVDIFTTVKSSYVWLIVAGVTFISSFFPFFVKSVNLNLDKVIFTYTLF